MLLHTSYKSDHYPVRYLTLLPPSPFRHRLRQPSVDGLLTLCRPSVDPLSTLCRPYSAGVSGAIVTGTGRYWHILLFSPALICVGAGLLFSISAETSSAKLIGFQIIFAVGIGLIFQQTIIAVQADTADPTDIPQATAAVTFTQLVGGTGELARTCQKRRRVRS